MQNTATHPSDGCGISRSRVPLSSVQLAAPDLPAVNIGDIRIEGTCSLAKTDFVDFSAIDLVGDAFRLASIFGDAVQSVIHAVMMYHAPPDIVAVSVPLRVVALGVQDVGNVAAQNLVPLPRSSPCAHRGERDDNAFDFFYPDSSVHRSGSRTPRPPTRRR